VDLDESEDRNAMSFPALLSWAWRITPPTHQNAANLLIHLFAVPLFVAGNVLVIAGVVIDLRLLVVATGRADARLATDERWRGPEPGESHHRSPTRA